MDTETTPTAPSEQDARIITYVKILNTGVGEGDDELLGFAVSEVLDRVRIYLNRDDVPVLAERPIAKTISTVFNKYKKTGGDTDVEREVSSVSDNGQSVSYSTSVKQYLITASDEELFTGVATLLKPYRRLNFDVTTRPVSTTNS